MGEADVFTAPSYGANRASARMSFSGSPALDPFGSTPGVVNNTERNDDGHNRQPHLASSSVASAPASASVSAAVAFPTLDFSSFPDLSPLIPPDRRIKSEPVSPVRRTTNAPTTPSASKAAFVRGHRRRSTHVTRRDLDKFRKEALGVESPGFGFDDDLKLPASTNPARDPQFEALNRAFEAASMSLNNAGGMAGNNPGANMYAGYVDNTGGGPNMSNVPRQSMSPAMPHTPSQVNGAGMPGMNGGMPINAGQQMDLHHLYDMVLELSEVLKNNRETTKSIVNSAEEIMKRSSAEGVNPSIQQVNGELSAARIAELERALAKEKRLVEILRNEQVENTKLLGEYEAAVGVMVEQIRNYCQNNNLHYVAQKRHYNNLLQAERDSHLESRLDRDYWHAQTMKCAEMIRTAYRLRCEEEETPIRIVAGLQNEVRAYRNALGMEPEKPEEEYGWEILKDVPGGSE
ncbi:uncharacterized protein BO95DRAFT_486559 [Aspergillus brunneoviolaceus CBS 621.78]|uniref:Uncharacterized protein n=1 Tax=Aspergillus brunneoviolaceus CBS 621.78 TaxID=1450534 RepID=A0ACD1FSP5_9EURO|nr:hypothetical protein BO95DRAFT_486559 [Aspergillus brunneoviolaceus CBS 621.78]RAH39997.1 hypothetical protein BO95DRAFT_486559 [Aspergillus brunneoviolaceus CBS 621.78]